MDKTIFYIGFYDIADSKYKRNYALAAKSKMDYIASVLVRLGYTVEIISSSWLIGSNPKFVKGFRKKIDNNIFLSTLPSFSSKKNLGLYIKILFTLFSLLWKLLPIRKHQTVIVYHSPWLSIPLRVAKKIKKFKLILEIEEIYADITSLGKVFDRMEYALIDSADAYLLSTDLLRKKLSEQKPGIIIYGTYQAEPILAMPDSTNKIRVLYSGIIDTKKAGAFNALNAAKYLNEKYELRIIGFGETKTLIEEIEIVNKTSRCKVFFDGTLSGDQYISYCQRCHIGLATQKLEGKYLESSFPSKILSYLSMGINVISGRIKCVEISQIGAMISFYEADTSQSIARAIQEIKLFPPGEIRKKIKQLDNNFMVSLKDLIN